MAYNDLLTLVTQTVSGVNDYGDPVITETTRQIFAQQASIGMQEFYQAQASGFKPEIKFRVADYLDYSGEAVAVYGGRRYSVLRTYRSGNELELVCTAEVHPNGGT